MTSFTCPLTYSWLSPLDILQLRVLVSSRRSSQSHVITIITHNPHVWLPVPLYQTRRAASRCASIKPNIPLHLTRCVVHYLVLAMHCKFVWTSVNTKYFIISPSTSGHVFWGWRRSTLISRSTRGDSIIIPRVLFVRNYTYGAEERIVAMHKYLIGVRDWKWRKNSSKGTWIWWKFHWI